MGPYFVGQCGDVIATAGCNIAKHRDHGLFVDQAFHAASDKVAGESTAARTVHSQNHAFHSFRFGQSIQDGNHIVRRNHATSANHLTPAFDHRPLEMHDGDSLLFPTKRRELVPKSHEPAISLE